MMLAERLGGRWEVVRFIVTIAIYCGTELFALMSGFRLIHYASWHPVTALIGWGAGSGIEMTLRILRGDRVDAIRDFSISKAFGAFYLIPPLLGVVGAVIRYFLPLSILGFLALMGRLACQLSTALRRTLGEPEQSQDEAGR